MLRGLKGEPVRLLQERLGVEADGVFGGGTEKALKDYQKANNLTVDGIAGPDTFASMGLLQLVLLKRGSKGAQVKKMQEALGIDADGKFGPGTEKALREYQEANGLKADGLAGPRTLASLNLFAGADQTASGGGGALSTADAASDGGIWDSVEEAAAGALDRVKSIFGF
ncbi:MAG: peptidoglycan-binding protein [Fimbriimonadaceae bacterium]|nr:peptidoglycan-binding protein [Alphaproteobacteria bacterium]